MKVVEKSGRSIGEAVALALAELGVQADEVTVEVLEEARKGVLGLIGAKSAVVRVTVNEMNELPAPTVVPSSQAGSEASVGKAEKVERLLQDICRAMRVEGEVAVRSDGEAVHADVTGPEAGILIGHHGQTLDALQFLVNLACAKSHDDGVRVIVDVEGYRRRRDETLTRLASRLAERVRRTGEGMALEPMSAQERRIIHMALSDNPHVSTASEGEEPNRRVVISPRR